MFKTLSVAETNYDSDRIIFKYTGSNFSLNRSRYTTEMTIEVSSNGTLIFTSGNSRIQLHDFTRKDIKDLIGVLQEAETFLSEAELVEKLIGK